MKKEKMQGKNKNRRSRSLLLSFTLPLKIKGNDFVGAALRVALFIGNDPSVSVRQGRKKLKSKR